MDTISVSRRVLFTLAGTYTSRLHQSTVLVPPTTVMGFFRRVFMSTTQSQSVHDERLKHGGVPAIPTDIGYKSGKETKGAKENGVLSQAVSNPGVVLGLGLTTAALLGMLRKSFIGDKAGAQKMMQYRIMAQFFTITALVAGVTVFGTVYESKEEREKREDAERIAALALKH